jgi:hypothetical protein
MTISNHSEPILANANQTRYVGDREFHNDPKSVYVLAKDEIEKNRLRQVSKSSPSNATGHKPRQYSYLSFHNDSNIFG